MTQRFPKGVPAYLSLDDDNYESPKMEPTQAIEEPTPDIHIPTESPRPRSNFHTKPWQEPENFNVTISPAQYHVTPRRGFELPYESSGFKQNRILSSLSPQLKRPPAKRPVSSAYKSHSPINARKPQSGPHFKDPIKIKCNSPPSTDSESEDESGGNRAQEYGNHFTTVISDLKKKFVTSNKELDPSVKKSCSMGETENDDFQKGSDYCIEDARDKPQLERGISFNDSQGKQAMKDDLEEVYQFISYFLRLLGAIFD